MLLGTVLLWALNTTVTRYVLTHGFQPLAYATIRYAAATALFVAFTYYRERSFRIARRDLRYVALAAAMIFCNQVSFVYSIDKTSAATVTLFLGTTPIFIGVFASLVGLERMHRAFWVAAAVSLVGVALVASGSGGFSGHRLGDVDRPRDGGDVGRLLDRDHTSDAALLAAFGSARSSSRAVGCRSRSSGSPRRPASRSTSAGACGSASRSPSSGPSS